MLRQAWVGGLKSVLERAEQMTEVQKVVKQGVKRLGMGWCQNQVGEGAAVAVAVAVGILGCQGEGMEVGEGEGVGEVVGVPGTVPLWGPGTALMETVTGSLGLIAQALAGSVLDLGFVL